MSSHAFGIAIAIVSLAIGVFMMIPAVMAWLNGERPFATRATPIADLRPGRAILCGHVEPAWCCLTSPIDKVSCVYFNARATTYYGRDTRTIFHRRNAVPFVLNDGTGRVIVLSRDRAWWDPARGAFDPTVRWTGEQAERDAEALSRISEQPNREFAPPHEPLVDDRDDHYSDSDVQRFGKESTVAIGERVTVIGWASDFPPGMGPGDGVGDDGTSLGLAGRLVMAWHANKSVSVISGAPEQIAQRVHVRLAVAAAGALIAVIALGVLVTLL